MCVCAAHFCSFDDMRCSRDLACTHTRSSSSHICPHVPFLCSPLVQMTVLESLDFATLRVGVIIVEARPDGARPRVMRKLLRAGFRYVGQINARGTHTKHTMTYVIDDVFVHVQNLKARFPRSRALHALYSGTSRAATCAAAGAHDPAWYAECANGTMRTVEGCLSPSSLAAYHHSRRPRKPARTRRRRRPTRTASAAFNNVTQTSLS